MTALYILAAIGATSVVLTLPVVVVCIGYSIKCKVNELRG